MNQRTKRSFPHPCLILALVIAALAVILVARWISGEVPRLQHERKTILLGGAATPSALRDHATTDAINDPENGLNIAAVPLSVAEEYRRAARDHWPDNPERQNEQVRRQLIAYHLRELRRQADNPPPGN